MMLISSKSQLATGIEKELISDITVFKSCYLAQVRRINVHEEKFRNKGLLTAHTVMVSALKERILQLSVL